MRARGGMLLAVGALALVVGPVGAARAASDPSGRVSTVSQGWWNQSAVPLPAPDDPVTGVAPLPSAPPPDVPDGVVPVTMRLGQVSRVAAIGMTLDAPPGTQVDRLVLHLPESGEPMAQQGSGAAVRACPITDFLVAEENGDPANTPAADCEVAHADGVRGDDGTWTFDLTAIGQAWASGALSVNGIRLEPIGDAPATFQVGFAGYDDATVEADLVAGSGGSDPFGDLTSGATSDFGSSFGDSTSDAAFADPGPAEVVATGAPATAKPRRTVPIAANQPATSFVGSALANALAFVGLLALGLATMLRLGAPPEATAVTARARGVARPVASTARRGGRRA